ncbi:HEAT repeat domain-containing protein, partial [Candidatus Poribacteria bacterium]
IMAMASGEHWTRRTVISILCRVGDPKAIPCIVDALGDPGRKIRSMAMNCVVKLGQGSEELKKLLIEAAEGDNPRLRANAIKALRLVDDKGSEPLEIALKSLEDVDPKVRQAGIKALEKIGGQQSIDGLKRALDDADRNVAINAAFALSDMEDEAQEILKEALQDDSVQKARCAAHALAEVGDNSGINLVIDALNDNGWEMWCTPFTLAESGDKRAAEALLNLVESSLHTENLPSQATLAVKALGKCTDERAADMLRTVLYEKRDRKFRRAAVMALLNIGTEKAVDILLGALVSEDGNLRQHARNALIKTGPEILPRLKTLAEQVEGKPRRSVESLLQAIM